MSRLDVKDQVVITGMGIVSSIGFGEVAFWESVLSGRSGAGPVENLDTSELTRHIACPIREPLGGDESLGRASNLAILAASEALESAKLNADDISSVRSQVLIGTTMGETGFIEARLQEADDRWLDHAHTQKIFSARPGSIARNVQNSLHLKGRVMDLYGACAAGNMAFAMAKRALLRGECDIVLAGGADGFSTLAFMGFMRSRVMASEVCRPFDQQRDGLLVGEGAGMFVLERASSARARGVRPRALIAGVGLSCESYHPTRPHPEGDGLSRAIESAFQDADVGPSEIDYVCAHGTGTPHNDAIEAKVMTEKLPASTPFSSLKALTGHPMGAASALETALCVLSMEHQTLIPTWHLEEPLEPCALEALSGKPKAAKLKTVMNNSAGFGGYNASLILTKP